MDDPFHSYEDLEYTYFLGSQDGSDVRRLFVTDSPELPVSGARLKEEPQKFHTPPCQEKDLPGDYALGCYVARVVHGVSAGPLT